MFTDSNISFFGFHPLDFWSNLSSDQQSDVLVLVTACLGAMFSFYLMELFLKKVLELMEYSDIHEHVLEKGHYTRQVNLMSTFITGALAMVSYQEHGFFHTDVSCSAIRSYDIDTQFISILVFLSYLAYDAVFHKLSFEHYIHHTLGFSTVAMMVLARSSYGVYFTSAGMLIEASTVPMNLIFVTSGITKDILMGVFALTFFIVRPVFMMIILKEMVNCGLETRIEQIGICAFLALYILNLYWFGLLCRKIYRKIYGISKLSKQITTHSVSNNITTTKSVHESASGSDQQRTDTDDQEYNGDIAELEADDLQNDDLVDPQDPVPNPPVIEQQVAEHNLQHVAHDNRQNDHHDIEGEEKKRVKDVNPVDHKKND